MPDIRIRPATPQDAQCVVDLSEMASYGLMSLVLDQCRPEGTDLHSYMLALVLDPASKVSLYKCHLAEMDGAVVGLLNLDQIPLDPDPSDAATPAMFRPLAELEAQAAGTTVIEFICTLPRARGKGVGTALMRHAHGMGGPNGLSLIVFDTNVRARHFYERLGFGEADRRKIVKGNWQTDATEWILMLRP